jgi:hypothetical protein
VGDDDSIGQQQLIIDELEESNVHQEHVVIAYLCCSKVFHLYFTPHYKQIIEMDIQIKSLKQQV